MPWKYMKIKNDDFAISAEKTNSVWKITLTDFVGIWSEKLQTETIVERSKKLNPLLRIQALNFDEIMEEILTNIPQYSIEESAKDKIILKKNIQGGLLKFEVHLKEESATEYFEVIVKSFSLFMMNLLHKNSILLETVKAKDVEIAEYKAEGARLLRKNIETKPFSEESCPQYTDGIESQITIKALVGLCNEAEKAKMKKCPISRNSKSFGESIEINVKTGGSSNNVSQLEKTTVSSTNTELKNGIESKEMNIKQGEERSEAKKGKRGIIASYKKPIKKSKSRVTSFIS